MGARGGLNLHATPAATVNHTLKGSVKFYLVLEEVQIKFRPDIGGQNQGNVLTTLCRQNCRS